MAFYLCAMNYNNAPIAKAEYVERKETKLSALLIRLEACLSDIQRNNSRIDVIIEKVDGSRVKDASMAPHVGTSTGRAEATLFRLQNVLTDLEGASSNLNGNVNDLEILF